MSITQDCQPQLYTGILVIVLPNQLLYIDMVIDKANVATQEEKDMNITILAQVQQEIIIKRFAENSH